MSQNTSPKRALEAINLNAPLSELWLLSDPDIVWGSYEEAKASTGTGSYDLFFHHVIDCIEDRISNTSQTSFDPTKKGAWLNYYPENALFEDVAMYEAPGFFGSGDCPPPAFWTHLERDVLVSFIPNRYIETASIGVDVCVNETLVWSSAPTEPTLIQKLGIFMSNYRN
jgi:hypothetical protein